MKREVTTLLALPALSVFLLWGTPLQLHAQLPGNTAAAQRETQVSLQGKVVDTNGDPVPGAVVSIAGKRNVTTTDVDGRFRLPIGSAQRAIQVEVTYLGMAPQRLLLNAPFRNVVITLTEQVNELSEVVTTGYNRMLKRRTAGSFAEVGKEKIENQVPTSIDKILQGQVAGVNVSLPSGKPGSEAQVRIRGVNTVSGSAEPLWVVDGVPVQDNLPPLLGTGLMDADDFNDIFRNGIGDINPNDIESVTVLKDAVAAAIYGSRSAGGVIVITTKSGKAGKLRLNYSTNLTLGLKPQRRANLMSASEKIDWEQQLWDEFSAENYASGKGWYPVIGITGMVNADKIGKGGRLWTETGFEPMTSEEKTAYLNELRNNGVNWYDEIFRHSFSQQHNFSLSGGTNRVNYYASLGYTNDQGLVKENSYQRYNFNMRIGAQLSSKLKVDFKSSVGYQVSHDYVASVDPFKYAYFANPYEKPYNADGTYRSDMTWFNIGAINAGDVNPPSLPAAGFNILRDMKEAPSRNSKLGVTLTGSFDYFITNNLKLSGLGSYTLSDTRSLDEMGKDTYAAFLSRLTWDVNVPSWDGYGVLRQSFNQGNSYMGRLTLNYTRDFARKHHLMLLGGSEIRAAKNERSAMQQYGYDPETKITGTPQPPSTADMSVTDWIKLIDRLSSSQWDENKYASFFATADYNFNDTYTLNAAVRTDGSNNFGSKEQFNPTWSVGAAWNADNERFWKPLRPYINRFTVRASYGYTGNVVQGLLKNLIIKTSSKKWQGHTTGTVNTAPNPHLRWERTRDKKIGVDMGFLRDRLTFQLEAYEKLSSDVITEVGMVSTTGFIRQSFNTSKIRNRGLEITLSGTPVKTNDLTVSASANLSWNRNELVEYVAPFFGTSSGKYAGYPLDAIFQSIPEGISPETGLYTFRLVPEAKIESDADLRKVANYIFYRGTANAPYSGGGNLSVRYKCFTFNVYAAYSIGRKVIDEISSPVNKSSVGYGGNNSPQTDYADLYINHLNVTRDRIDRWTTTHTTGVLYPRIVDAFGPALNLEGRAPTGINVTNAIYLRSVSFLRIRNMSLAYNVDSKYISSLGLSKLGVSLSLQNFFTVTNYKGIDPEQPGATYPLTRSVTLGVQVGF